MIISFDCRETEKIFNLEFSKKLPPMIQQVALRKLKMLHRSNSLWDLSMPPANHLEKLSGNLEEKWSIRINKQWRICFSWHEGNAYSVEIIDYHK